MNNDRYACGTNVTARRCSSASAGSSARGPSCGAGGGACAVAAHCARAVCTAPSTLCGTRVNTEASQTLHYTFDITPNIVQEKKTHIFNLLSKQGSLDI